MVMEQRREIMIRKWIWLSPIYFPFSIQGCIKISGFMRLGVEWGYTNRHLGKKKNQITLLLSPYLSLYLWRSMALESSLLCSTWSVKNSELKTSQWLLMLAWTIGLPNITHLSPSKDLFPTSVRVVWLGLNFQPLDCSKKSKLLVPYTTPALSLHLAFFLLLPLHRVLDHLSQIYYCLAD